MKHITLGRSLTAILLTAVIVPTAALAARALRTERTASHPSAQVSLTSLKVTGSTVLIDGHVRLDPNTSAQRHKTRVALTLRSSKGSSEKLVKLVSGSSDKFTTSWHTSYTGELTLSAIATVSGSRSGSIVKRALAVVGTVTSGGPIKLLGVFDLTAGSNPRGKVASGTYFVMETPKGNAFANVSAGGNDDFTPLRPGKDGGLSTVVFQRAPTPAFAKSGSARADQIIEPTGFEGDNFSVDTNSTDVQTGATNPLPVIYDSDGTLSGQITAWDAQWNRQNFNQGSPKPGGGLPGATTVLSGTYDATTGAFTLTWKSLIVGGPFNGFIGLWHLVGHFVPAP
jgi:archaellin